MRTIESKTRSAVNNSLNNLGRQIRVLDIVASGTGSIIQLSNGKMINCPLPANLDRVGEISNWINIFVN